MARVRLLAPSLRARHGGARELGSEAASVEDLLAELDVEANEDLRVLVNGRAIAFLDGLATRLGRDDVVSLAHVGIRGWPGG